MDLRDHGRALTHGSGDAFGRSGPNVADSKHAAKARLQRKRRSAGPGFARQRERTGRDEAIGVQVDAAL